jgi:hypothetical protein
VSRERHQLAAKKGEPVPDFRAKRPVLRGFVDGKLIRVFCPHCDRFHTHGWDGRRLLHRTVLREQDMPDGAFGARLRAGARGSMTNDQYDQKP